MLDPNPSHDLLQDSVAGLMAVSVINGLELIDVVGEGPKTDGNPGPAHRDREDAGHDG